MYKEDIQRVEFNRLIYAIEQGSFDVAKLFISDTKLDIARENNKVLKTAIKLGYEEKVCLLLSDPRINFFDTEENSTDTKGSGEEEGGEGGSNTEELTESSDEERTDEARESVVQIFVQSRNVSLIKAVLTHPRVNLETGPGLNILMVEAAIQGNEIIIEYLLNNCRHQIGDILLKNTLALAKYNCKDEVVKLINKYIKREEEVVVLREMS